MGACKYGIQNTRHIAIPTECNSKWNQNVSTLFCLAWENESVDIVGSGIYVKCVDVFYRSYADGGDVTFYNPKSNKKLLLIQHPRGRYNQVFRVLRLASWRRSGTVLAEAPEGIVYVTGVQLWNTDLPEAKRDVHLNQDSQISTTSVDLPLTHCGRVTQICVFNKVKLGTSASSP